MGRAGRDWLYLWVGYRNKTVPKTEMEHGTPLRKLSGGIQIYKLHQVQFDSCRKRSKWVLMNIQWSDVLGVHILLEGM